jgi:hypothetical protein
MVLSLQNLNLKEKYETDNSNGEISSIYNRDKQK